MKLNVYSRLSGKNVFKDFERTIQDYENKICKRIVLYKFNKIFVEMLEEHDGPMPFMLKKKKYQSQKQLVTMKPKIFDIELSSDEYEDKD